MVHRVRYYATICECSFSSKFFSLYCEAKLILSGCELACYSKLVGSSQKKLATAKEKVKGVGNKKSKERSYKQPRNVFRIQAIKTIENCVEPVEFLTSKALCRQMTRRKSRFLLKGQVSAVFGKEFRLPSFRPTPFLLYPEITMLPDACGGGSGGHLNTNSLGLHLQVFDVVIFC